MIAFVLATTLLPSAGCLRPGPPATAQSPAREANQPPAVAAPPAAGEGVATAVEEEGTAELAEAEVVRGLKLVLAANRLTAKVGEPVTFTERLENTTDRTIRANFRIHDRDGVQVASYEAAADGSPMWVNFDGPTSVLFDKLEGFGPFSTRHTRHVPVPLRPGKTSERDSYKVRFAGPGVYRFVATWKTWDLWPWQSAGRPPEWIGTLNSNDLEIRVEPAKDGRGRPAGRSVDWEAVDTSTVPSADLAPTEEPAEQSVGRREPRGDDE